MIATVTVRPVEEWCEHKRARAVPECRDLAGMRVNIFTDQFRISGCGGRMWLMEKESARRWMAVTKVHTRPEGDCGVCEHVIEIGD